MSQALTPQARVPGRKMDISQALRLRTPQPASQPDVEAGAIRIAFTGSGGKTTALFQLARQLEPPVVLTASTHLHVDQVRLADSHRIAASPSDLDGLEENLHGVVLVTGPAEGKRTAGLEARTLDRLRELCDRRALPLLLEADGSRRRPLKAPAQHEPAIPEFAGTVVVTAGLSGLDRPLSEETVHRPEIFARLGGLRPGDPVTDEALARVLTHPQGGLKNVPASARRIALLNQADTPELQARANQLAERLLQSYQAVLVASLDPQSSIPNPRSRVHAVHEAAAGIVLAAGEARRFGRPKQLLDFHGQPFVRGAARAAMEAGLSPVVVVTGAGAEDVQAALEGLPVEIVHNPHWRQGQGASIRAGVGTMGGRAGSAIFLLADQPQVTPAVLRALRQRHTAGLPPVVAPLVGERRANPVLFDRLTFPDLMALQGDVGGRALFDRYPPVHLPWNDESLLLDVDTAEDYRKLMRLE